MNMIKDVANWPQDVAEFPKSAKAVGLTGPVDLLMALQTLYENTDEEKEAYVPHFVGIVLENLDEDFIKGIVALGKLQPHFKGWMAIENSTPSKLKKSAATGPLFSCQLEMICTLDRSGPIPFHQLLNCRIIYLSAAALITKPELLKLFAKLGGFQVIVDMIEKEVTPPAADTLQNFYCDFVSYFTKNPKILKKLLEMDVHSTLMTLSNSKAELVRKYSANLLGKIGHSKSKTVSKYIDPGSIDTLLVSLCTDMKDAKTKDYADYATNLISMIDSQVMASDGAKDQVCETRNMKQIVQYFLKYAASRASFMENDSNCSYIPLGVISMIGNALGGSVERQEKFARDFGATVVTRLVSILNWIGPDADPTTHIGSVTTTVCTTIYKISARTQKGVDLLYDANALKPLLLWLLKILQTVLVPGFTGLLSGSDENHWLPMMMSGGMIYDV